MEKQQHKVFAGNWMCIQTLGEGAYGDVKLLKHQISGETVAVKIVNFTKQKDAEESVKKEARIHAILDHANIIKLYGRRKEANNQVEYIFLEYAAGGELFDKIEPDVGMPYAVAQKYMRQLLDGLDYLHQKGIAHRDIKPENLLLDSFGNLKISDFGMATVFRLRGRERPLDKKCGTLPYVAPEVLRHSYFAQPADIWSCGVVLVTMVAGELPWNEPTHKCSAYSQWCTDQYLLSTPWSKLENILLGLTRKILNPSPSSRPTIEQILHHPWMQIRFTSSTDPGSTLSESPVRSYKRRSSLTNSRTFHEAPTVTLSQPVRSTTVLPENLSELLKTRETVSFSQPTHNDDLIVSSPTQFSNAPLTQHDFQHLIRRMTRFFVKTSCEKTIELVGEVLDSLNYAWNTDAFGTLTITTVDSRKMQLIFKANLIEMDGKLLLDFRLSKGCGLEFKRRFMKLKNCLSDIVLHSGA